MAAPAPHRRCRAALLALLVPALVALAGCAGDGDGGDDLIEGPSETRTTRVQVVEGIGEKGGFDPRAIYKQLSPGVVTVLSIFGSGAGTPLQPGGQGGQGSGFVLDGQGYVATNAHVVTTGRASSRRARQVFVEFSDGNRVEAKIVGADPNADVAVLKIDPAGLDLTPLPLGQSGELTVGAPVAAIGSPFGERQSLSVGVISALDRSIESLTAFQIGDAIQTDAAINPGNSGGPLLNSRGQVIGINAQIKSESGGGEGVGFAIPADTVRRSVRELRRDGTVDYGYLGVSAQPLYPQLARRLDLDVTDGALIATVEDNSPADKAGLREGDETINFQGSRRIPTGGDVIVEVDGNEVTRTRDLADLIGSKQAGDEVRLTVLRDGDRRDVEVTLGRRPNRPPEQQP